MSIHIESPSELYQAFIYFPVTTMQLIKVLTHRRGEWGGNDFKLIRDSVINENIEMQTLKNE